MHIDISPEIPLHPFMALKDDPQYEYKLALRDWMKGRGLSIRWLASWIEKSETTVKNFLYGTKPIAEENKEKIEALQAEYEDGEDINHCLSTGHRLISNNPDFDPVPKREVSGSDQYRSVCVMENTYFLLNNLNIRSSPCSDIFGMTVFSYMEVNAMLDEVIKETIFSYMKRKQIGVEKLISSVQSVYYIGNWIHGEKDAVVTDEVLALESSKYSLHIPEEIGKYAGLAAAIEGAPYIDVWINSVVYKWAKKRQVEELSDFLGL